MLYLVKFKIHCGPGDSSGGKVLAKQVWGPEFWSPAHPQKRNESQIDSCEPSTWEQRQREPQDLMASQTVSSRFSERSCLKNKSEERLRKIPSVDLQHTRVHACTRVCTHTHIMTLASTCMDKHLGDIIRPVPFFLYVVLGHCLTPTLKNTRKCFSKGVPFSPPSLSNKHTKVAHVHSLTNWLS